MNRPTKTVAAITSSLFLMLCMLMPSITNAQQTVFNDGDSYQTLNQAELDQALAPIALYPDSLLSQILVASTYPLEVVQANRWRQANYRLSENKVLDAIEYQDWDPSVKALAPFTDLLARLSDDLYWLQQLGDAFLQNEGQVLATIQGLRHKAYKNGSLADSDYYHIVQDDGYIVIHSTNTEFVYVPYYDSRVVYGRWAWSKYKPVYWHRPSRYKLHAGFYWSNQFYIRPTIFFGGFHWSSRNLVVNKHYYDEPYRQKKQYRNLGVSKYSHWKHNSAHRRGVKYSGNVGKKIVQRNRFNSRSKINKTVRQRTNERRAGTSSSIVSRSQNRQTSRKNDQNKSQQVKQKISGDKRRVQGQVVSREQSRSQSRRDGSSSIRTSDSGKSKIVSAPKKFSKGTTGTRQNNANNNNNNNSSSSAASNRRSAIRNAKKYRQQSSN